MSKIVKALQKVNGIDATEAAALEAAGIKTFAELRALDSEDLGELIGSENAVKAKAHLAEIVKANPDKSKLKGYPEE